MLIVGMDVSKIHYGLVVRKFFKENEFITDYIFMNKSKPMIEKGERKGFRCHHIKDTLWFKKNIVDDNLFYTMYVLNIIEKYILSDLEYMEQEKDEEKYLGIEGYAWGGISGQLLQLAEVGSLVKKIFFDHNWKIRIHDPLSLKLWATGNGHAQKREMIEFAIRNHLAIPEFMFNPKKEKNESAEDIADALFLMQMVQVELQVRSKPSLLDTLSENQKLIFNRVTQQSPINLLNRPFINKEAINVIEH